MALRAGTPDPVDFIVIGAMRTATTTLNRYLRTHSQIAMSREKETDFFVGELNHGRGLDWYRSLFPQTDGLRGECSPNYSKFDVFPGVPERIAHHAPGARLIYVVRDPVDRAVSQYGFWHASRFRRNEITEAQWTHFLNTSRYYAQLRKYYAVFDPERILVLEFDEIHKDRGRGALRRISGFLEIDDTWDIGNARQENSTAQLSRMPGWFFALRGNRLVSVLRRRLPAGISERLRTLLASGSERPAPVFPSERLSWLRAELEDDVRNFRKLTGLPLENWSV